jgi:hypothetical protein
MYDFLSNKEQNTHEIAAQENNAYLFQCFEELSDPNLLYNFIVIKNHAFCELGITQDFHSFLFIIILNLYHEDPNI